MTNKPTSSLTARIVIGMVSGILLGFLLQKLMPNGSDYVLPLYIFDLSIRELFVDGIFEVGGQIFVASLKNAGGSPRFCFFNLWDLFTKRHLQAWQDWR